jgi:hypothetical protein
MRLRVALSAFLDVSSLNLAAPSGAAFFLSEAPLHPEAVRIRFYFQSGIPDDPRLCVRLGPEADYGLPGAIMLDDLHLEAGLVASHGNYVACHMTV